jgi:hypothetical protein
MIFFCDEVLNSGSLLKAAEAAWLGDPGEKFRTKNEERRADEVFYAVRPVTSTICCRSGP